MLSKAKQLYLFVIFLPASFTDSTAKEKVNQGCVL